MLKFIFLGLSCLGTLACASRAVQTEELFSQEVVELNSNVQVAKVPFINQSEGYCGPATLAMAMNWAGNPVTVEEIAPQVFSNKMNGSLQTDLITAARRRGMMAVTIEGLPALLSEVQDGHPVIVFENLAFDWWPRWHFALVFGYDLNQQQVVMHSGPEENKRWDMEVFERSWMLGNYWGLVVLPAGEIAVAGGELANLNSAAALEQLGNLTAAELSYQKILERWPESLGALIGLGNVSYERKEYEASYQYLQRATHLHPEAEAAWHNMRIAEQALSAKEKARKKTSRASMNKSSDQL